MKMLTIATTLISFASFSVISLHAQQYKRNVVSNTSKANLSQLLTHYYGIKDALVAGNTAYASAFWCRSYVDL